MSDTDEDSGTIPNAVFFAAVAFVSLIGALWVLACFAKCCPSRRRHFPRNNSLHSLGHADRSDPPNFTSDRRRRSTGDEPGISDVCISSWYPPRSWSENLGLTQSPRESEKGSTVVSLRKRRWAGFLVSCGHSTHPWVAPCAYLLVLCAQPLSVDILSGADTTSPSSQVKVRTGDGPTSSTRVQVSTLILMPSRRSVSMGNHNGETLVDRNTCGPPREFTLGTFSFPYGTK